MADQEFNPVLLGADTTELQASGMSHVGAALTKGVGAAAASGLLSIYNTFVPEANEVDTLEFLNKIDTGLGDYYQEHKEGVDIVGFVGTSILPGMAGMKALKMARAGLPTGAVGRALNLPLSKKTLALESAMKELASSGGAVQSFWQPARLRILGWEIADQAMMGAAAEIAIGATMFDSPVFDNSSLADMSWNAALGVAASGLIGGPLASVGARGILKDVQRTVETQKRLVDTVFDPKMLNINKGTETLLMAESIAKLPDEAINVTHKYVHDGYNGAVALDLSGTLKEAKARAVKSGEQALALKFNELADGDVAFGQSYFNFFKRGVEAARAAGKTADEQIELVNGYLNNVVRVAAIDTAQMEIDAAKFYVRLEPKIDAQGILQPFSAKRIPKETGKSAYLVRPGVQADDIITRSAGDFKETSLKDIFRNNPEVDVVLTAGGRPAINPKSARIKRVIEDNTKVRMFIDLESGSLADEAVAAFADVISKGRFTSSIDEIATADGKHVFKQASTDTVDISKSAIQGSSRWAWASRLDAAQFAKLTAGEVDAHDLPMLARLVEFSKSAEGARFKDWVVNFADGRSEVLAELGSASDILRRSTYEVLAEQLGKGVHYDLRHIAAHVNQSQEFLEEAIRRTFTPPTGGEIGVPMLTTADALVPKAATVTWDFSATAKLLDPLEAYKQQFGPALQATRELSRQYQLATQTLVNRNAGAAALGELDDLFLDAPKDLALRTSQEGAGAGAFTASNASYGETAKLWVQDTGKNVGLATQRLADSEIGILAPHVNAIRDSQEAAAELGILTNALRRSEFRYVFNPDGKNQLISTHVRDVMRKEKLDLTAALAKVQAESTTAPRIPHILEIKDTAVANFMREHVALNTRRQNKFTTLYNAAGLTRQFDTDGIVYAPPVNSTRYPFHAFVTTKRQIGVASDVTMLTARTRAELDDLVRQVDIDKFDVHFKKDTEAYHKIKGDYDYAMTLNESSINSELRRSGRLADTFPETRAENVLQDYLEFTHKQNEKLVRTAVQVKNRQFFSELEFLSANYRIVDESVTRGIGALFKSKVDDPFKDYIKTALNISKQQEYPLLDKLNEFVDALGLEAGTAIAKARDDAMKSTVSWQQADEIAARYGLGRPYAAAQDSVQAYIAANVTTPPNLIKEYFSKANMLLANFTLRLDFANSLINMISTPIMLGTEMSSIKTLVGNNSELAGKLLELRSVAVPGRDFRMPSTTKLLASSINNFFGADKATLLQRYKDIGAIKDVSRLYHEVLDNLAFDAQLKPGAWFARVDGAVDKLATYTGNQFSEDLTRFVAADVMRQLTDPLLAAGKMTVKEQNAYISTFVNRVQGNYVTSQRPVIFQGTTGAAVSLFQTYAFNVLQQLFRHVEGGDKRTLAVFAGLQSTVFGLNGLPFFDATNSYLIGSWLAGNSQHKDTYSQLPQFNKELGEWMLYGTASAMPLFSGSSPALFSRGDINPRHLSIIPVNPLDVPAVQASLRLVDTVWQFGKNVAGGVDLSTAMLQGLEHHGINRPLAGFAQLLAGRSTTSQGSLISAANDMQATTYLGALQERVVSVGGVSRLMGARPMDEAVALNTIYRNKYYEALDKARIASLGRKVKSSLYGGEAPSDEELEDFMASYAASGGRVENFNQSMQRWAKDANVSVINQLSQQMSKPVSRSLLTLMGGEPMPDYANSRQYTESSGE